MARRAARLLAAAAVLLGAAVPAWGGAPGRRAMAIDACPTDWEPFFHPAALEWICECAEENHRLHSHEPYTTNDHSHTHKACPTTTPRMPQTTPGPTTTSALVTTTTATTTRTSTTLYCEACTAVTGGPSTKTTTSTLSSTTQTYTSTATRTTTNTTTFTGSTTPPPSTTSVTSTTTSVSTVTETMTSTTTYVPVTNTSTSTKTSTSSTLTSTTITTTILHACSICPLYHFLCPDGCTNCVAAGMCRTVYHREDDMFDISCDRRRAITPPDPCVEFTDVQLSCPSGNLFDGRPVLTDRGSYPRIKCRVCGIEHLPADADPVQGFWTGDVSWGPNQFEGDISEIEIHSYKLYIVDAQYQKLGEPIAIQEVKLWATLRASCCDTGFYKARVEVELPQNYTYFMVVPVTIAGLELNVGPVSERIVDNDARLPALSGARRTVLSWERVFASAALPVLLALQVLRKDERIGAAADP